MGGILMLQQHYQSFKVIQTSSIGLNGVTVLCRGSERSA